MNNNLSFYLTIALYGTSTYCANYTHILYTESLALSTLIFSLYFLIKYIESKKTKYVILLSLFISWCVSLRPFVAPFIIIIGFYFLTISIKGKEYFKHFFICFFIISILLGLWTYRNYSITKQFIPLQSGSNWYKDNGVTEARFTFIKTFGLGWPWWDNRSENSWFLTDSELDLYKTTRPNDSIFLKNPLTRNMFCGGLTLDSLKKARNDYWQSLNPQYSKTVKDSFALQSAKMFNTFINFQKEIHPFHYYISYRFYVLFKYLNQPHGASIKSLKYPLNVVFTFLDAMVNYFVFFVGFCSIFLILAVKRYSKTTKLILTSVPLIILLYFSFVLRIDESRFVTLAFPFLLLCGIACIKIANSNKYRMLIFTLLLVLIIALGMHSVVYDINWG